jgi:hypothetical protein
LRAIVQMIVSFMSKSACERKVKTPEAGCLPHSAWRIEISSTINGNVGRDVVLRGRDGGVGILTLGACFPYIARLEA